jgi:serine/threonine protein kinase
LADDVEILSRARIGGVLDEKWTLERLLGVGGMAAVYAARHRNGAKAAVKVLHPHLGRYAEVRERFLREGYAANRVEHPGAVKVLDDDIIASGPDSGTAYIVMELLEGTSLQERLDKGAPISELEFLRIAGSVLEVLEAAHTRGVVHRDLKPENLFLMRPEEGDPRDAGAPPGGATGGRARIKVLDFGLARLLQAQAITTFGLALGTPSFMSPEQASGQSDQIDGRTDLFALAATGFRVRTGRRIHEGANAIELVRKMGTMAAPRLRTVASDASEPFARVIDRALEFRREDRYASAEAMRRDLERAIGELDIAAATAMAGTTGAAVPASSSRLPSFELSDPGVSVETSAAPTTRKVEPLAPLEPPPRPEPIAPRARPASVGRPPAAGSVEPHDLPTVIAGQAFTREGAAPLLAPPNAAKAAAAAAARMAPSPVPVASPAALAATTPATRAPSLPPAALARIRASRRSRALVILVLAVLAAIAIKVGVDALRAGAVPASGALSPSSATSVMRGRAWARPTVTREVLAVPPRGLPQEDSAAGATAEALPGPITAPASSSAPAASTPRPPRPASGKAGPAQVPKLTHKRRSTR